MKHKAKITVVGFDCDGTLTDGNITIGPNGESKSFYSADGQGISNLKEKGIILVMISGRTSNPTSERCAQLGFDYCYQGVENKLQIMEEIWKKTDTTALQTAYMGDDLPDIPLLQQVAISAAPADGHRDVLNTVSWISSKNAGRGAAREFCDLLLTYMPNQ